MKIDELVPDVITEDLGYELVLKKYSQNSITECNKILERCGGGHIGKLEKYA